MSSATMRILVVDDDADAAKLAVHMLQQDFPATEASFSGEAAQAYLEEHEIDILITDIKMKELSGLDLLAWVRAERPGVLSIVMTGHNDNENCMQALRLGAYDYRLKPLRQEDFLHSVRRAAAHLASERDLAEARNSLFRSQRVQSISMLAGGIAHEFNNLFGGILGYTDFARSGTDEAAKDRALAVISRASRRGVDLVRKLTRFAEKDELTAETMDLNEIIQNTLTLVESDFASHQIQVELDLGPVPEIQADRLQIQQVFLNLLTNARAAVVATHREGQRIHIETRATDDEVVMSIADNGEGVRPDMRDRIFDPFFTTCGVLGDGSDPTAKGLGLAVADGIVRKHGGTIRIEEKSGWSTVFKVTLPRVERQATQGDRGRVLICDESDDCAEVAKLLTAKGFHVVTVGSDIEALESMKQACYQVLLVDQRIAMRSGSALLSEVRASDPQTAILVMTKGHMLAIFRELLSAGATDCVPKPLNLRLLAYQVEKYCGLRDHVQIEDDGAPKACQQSEKHVLVVEPDPIMRNVYSMLLRYDGFRDVDEVDYDEALRRANDSRYDLVIMDGDLPRLGNPERIRELHACYPTTPILLLSHDPQAVNSRNCLRAGATAVTVTPLGNDRFLNEVANVLTLYEEQAGSEA